MFRMPYQTSATNPMPQTIGTSAAPQPAQPQQRQPFGGMVPGFASVLGGLPPQVAAQLFGGRFGASMQAPPEDLAQRRRRRNPFMNFMAFYGGRMPQDAPQNYFARMFGSGFGPNA